MSTEHSFEEERFHKPVRIFGELTVGGKINSVKVYKVLLNQSSTNAPVATVLENSLGTLTYTRVGVGQYEVDSSALFTANKTLIRMTCNALVGLNNAVQFIVKNTSTSKITIDTYRLSGTTVTYNDGELVNTPFEIEVYS